jgi:predicted DNA-binding transcriptional regulator AlpA
MMRVATLTLAQILELPSVVDLLTAGRALGLGRTTSYSLAREGAFPCRVIRAGTAYRVPTVELLRLLGMEPLPHPER